jgi:hypothetical protein
MAGHKALLRRSSTALLAAFLMTAAFHGVSSADDWPSGNDCTGNYVKCQDSKLGDDKTNYGQSVCGECNLHCKNKGSWSQTTDANVQCDWWNHRR